MGMVFLFLGFVGISCATALFPTIAIIVYRRVARSAGVSALHRIDVLIPAHDEERTIGPTLRAIDRAILHLRSNPKMEHIRVDVRVAADCCSDHTRAIAIGSASEVREVSFRSKWRSLRALIETSNAEWSVLVDCGALWPERLLEDLVPHMRRADVVGVAPTYRLSAAKPWERIHWGIERWLKQIESLAGGPLSVHGATVAYRTGHLHEALARLGDGTWLNDDVVIPWTLRFANPKMRIHYASDVAVDDVGVAKSAPEFPRRKRIAIGNLQWARDLFVPALRKNGVSGDIMLLGFRRIFRMLWIYPLLAFAIVIAGAWPVIIFALLLVVIRSDRALLSAAKASLLLPAYLSRRSAAWG